MTKATSMDVTTKISKFLSFILRHKPEAIGLSINSEGWADVGELVRLAQHHGHTITLEQVENVVATSDKKRFSLSSDKKFIRAVQGHSSPSAQLEFPSLPPPMYLYHGTATHFLKNIMLTGLSPQQRKYVHLSIDIATAKNVGMRYGQPAVLQIQSQIMHQQGYTFFIAENGVWLTQFVPPCFIKI